MAEGLVEALVEPDINCIRSSVQPDPAKKAVDQQAAVDLGVVEGLKQAGDRHTGSGRRLKPVPGQKNHLPLAKFCGQAV